VRRQRKDRATRAYHELCKFSVGKWSRTNVFINKHSITEPYLNPNSSSRRFTSNMSLAMSCLVATNAVGSRAKRSVRILQG
jgi:hypothetical protein